MAVNLYTIENLLLGKQYYSNSVSGEIIHAEKDNRAVWYGDNCEPYLVEIRIPSSLKNVWRTIAVRVSD